LRLLIVTPMHNEKDNVQGIHAALAAQTFQDFVWLVVDDGSSDGTADEVRALGRAPEPELHVRLNDGGLIAGSAYRAWRFGVEQGMQTHGESSFTHIMKLDADVRLPGDYLETVLAVTSERVGIAGGVITGRGHREQVHHVPGPVKLYTAAAYRSLASLPSAVGFDVMDEVCAERNGLGTQVVVGARFSLARAIGASEGGLHGRYRNGRVCRWTGYDPLYFLLHALRYAGRRPFVTGTVAMAYGYLTAGAGPYDRDLRRRHAQIQRAKLRSALRRPVSWVRTTYGY
jgi:dolichol-phosphate mannosyltransferase